MSELRLKYSFANALIFIILLWVIKLWEWSLDTSFGYYGIFPHSLIGLRGLLFAPLIHGDGYHLFNNSVAALFFLWTLFYFFPKEWLKIFLISYFVPNIFVWFLGRPAYHIGFSGVIFSLAFFEFLVGILAKSRQLMAISLIIVFLYGSLVWQIFPTNEAISWESHLFGALTGVLLAFVYYKKYSKKEDKIAESYYKSRSISFVSTKFYSPIHTAIISYSQVTQSTEIKFYVSDNFFYKFKPSKK